MEKWCLAAVHGKLLGKGRLRDDKKSEARDRDLPPAVMIESRHPNTYVIATGDNLVIGSFPLIAAGPHQATDWSALGNDVGNNL